MKYEELKELVGEIVSEDDGYYFTDIIRGYCDVDSKRIQYIEHDGGGEGGSEDCYSVIKVDGVFYKIEYNYYSYNGFDFDYAEVKVVNPVERLVTFYE